jgi:hypothetical protein
LKRNGEDLNREGARTHVLSIKAVGIQNLDLVFLVLEHNGININANPHLKIEITLTWRDYEPIECGGGTY